MLCFLWQDENLEEVRIGIKGESRNVHRKLRAALAELCAGCDTYTKMSSNLTIGAGSGKTKLDKHRLRSCKSHIVSVNDLTVYIKSIQSVNQILALLA